MNMNEEAKHDCVVVLRLPGPGCSHGSRRSSDITPDTGPHWGQVTATWQGTGQPHQNIIRSLI